MRELRFVSLTEDGGRLLVQSADGDEQFSLPVDAALRSAIRVEPPRPSTLSEQNAQVTDGRHAADAEPAVPAAPAEPAIGPREIQVRVRAGESPEHVATTFGMPLERVMRFAGPVLDERLRIADEARRARARRAAPDGGEGKHIVFGEAVDDRFRAHGIDADTVTWDARRRDDGEWLITAEWLGGADTHTAQWLFSRTTRSVVPLDDAAGDLLSDRPIRPVTPPPAARPNLTSAPPLAPGVVAFPPMPDAHTAPVPTVEEVFDQERAGGAPSSPVPAAAALDFDEPPLPLGITDPTERPGAAGTLRNLGAGRRDESDEERAARARIPSWDDILLGIKRRD